MFHFLNSRQFYITMIIIIIIIIIRTTRHLNKSPIVSATSHRNESMGNSFNYMFWYLYNVYIQISKNSQKFIYLPLFPPFQQKKVW